MRILIINTLYRPILPGGAEKSVSLLAEAFARHGDSVSVITLHPSSEVSVEMVNGVRVHRLPMDNAYWPYSSASHPKRKRLEWHVKDMWNRNAARRVGAILDEEKPDVVHTNQMEGFSVAIWREIKKRHIRLVHTLRGYYTLCPRSTMFRDGASCGKQCNGCKVFTYNRRMASNLVDGLISNSGYVLNKHVESGYFENAGKSVIFNIADVKTTTPKQVGAAKPRSELVFGFIGTVCPEKGIDIVLQACGRLTHANWRLNVAGTDTSLYASELKRKYTDPRISWLGFMKPAEYFDSIDVNIVPSLFPDPLPRTLIETYAYGKSAICAESGGIPEIASLGRVFATYPPLDVEALRGHMDEALSDVDTWRTGGFEAPEGMALFAESTVVNKYRSVYANA